MTVFDLFLISWDVFETYSKNDRKPQFVKLFSADHTTNNCED